MCPSRIPEGEQRGWIVPIGGAEDKESDAAHPQALRRAVRRPRRRHRRHPDRQPAGRHRRALRATCSSGSAPAASTSLDFDTRARRPSATTACARSSSATGIFFTGGNQLRISTILGGTPAAKLIRARNARGVHVAGTSAGASILSEHMIAFGKEGSSPRAGSVRLAPGLGLTNRFIIDQHFRQRDRLGRLLAALAYNPFAIGIGLDEDTAAFIGPDDTLEVEGSGAITVVDAGGLTFSSMADVAESRAGLPARPDRAHPDRRRDASTCTRAGVAGVAGDDKR